MELGDLTGWRNGGSMTGRAITIFGTNTETGAVLYGQCSGPGKWSLKIAQDSRVKKVLDANLDSETDAEMAALTFARDHAYADVKGRRGISKVVDRDGDRIRV